VSDFNDVITREAPWYTSDPPAGTTSTQFPPLQIVNGGLYDTVQAYYSKVIPRGKYLFLTCEAILNDELVEWQANREVKYQMLLTSIWSIDSGSGKLEDDQQNHHNALQLVLARVRGLIADHTHGGAFPTGVGVGGPEGDGRITMRKPNEYQQIANGEPLTAEIRYIATDWVPGGQ
jgi:hypothetical protein